LGGLGLTGHLLEVEFSLEKVPSAWVWAENQRVENFSELMTCLREASDTWPMTVSWVDSLSKGDALGRGIVMKGRWARADEAPSQVPTSKRAFSIPFDFPEWVLSKTSVQLFNGAYFRKQGKSGKGGIVDPNAFFYPLDRLQDWNRIYGRRGFVQYQCVIPKQDADRVGEQLLKTLAASGEGSFLSVVKDCGRQGKGMISFPMPGVSMAFDVPMRGDSTRTLVRKLNEIVLEAGGRIYLAKDALTPAETYRAMDPRWEAWNAVRRQWDPDGKLRSALSVRLFGD
jgi:FAD/FMN-containing dehydrogenase